MRALLFAALLFCGAVIGLAQSCQTTERVSSELQRVQIDGKPFLAVSERLADDLLRDAEKERTKRDFVQKLALSDWHIVRDSPPPVTDNLGEHTWRWHDGDVSAADITAGRHPFKCTYIADRRDPNKIGFWYCDGTGHKLAKPQRLENGEIVLPVRN